MNKRVTLQTPAGKTIVIVLRQMAHDVPAVVGRKFKYGGGACCTVLKVEPETAQGWK
jgi:hypothetical protein